MPNGDLTWKELLIVLGIWVWHLGFVLPTVACAGLIARCPWLPDRVRSSCRRYVSEYREMDE